MADEVNRNCRKMEKTQNKEKDPSPHENNIEKKNAISEIAGS